jgi:hypothetical protein
MTNYSGPLFEDVYCICFRVPGTNTASITISSASMDLTITLVGDQTSDFVYSDPVILTEDITDLSVVFNIN